MLYFYSFITSLVSILEQELILINKYWWVLGTDQISDCNSYCKCIIIGTCSVGIIIHILLKYWMDWTTQQVCTLKLHHKIIILYASNFLSWDHAKLNYFLAIFFDYSVAIYILFKLPHGLRKFEFGNHVSWIGITQPCDHGDHGDWWLTCKNRFWAVIMQWCITRQRVHTTLVRLSYWVISIILWE